MFESIPIEDEGETLQSFKTRITNNQFGVMVDFLMLNPELIRKNFTTYSKEKYFQKWEELTDLLNADFSGAKKDVQSWRKCWRDRKANLKTKAEKRDACLLEGTDPSPYLLTDSEEKLLQLIKEYEPEPDNAKYMKYLKEGRKTSIHLETKDTQQDLSNLDIQQKIKDNVSQILGTLNKQEVTNSTNQLVDNLVTHSTIMNNIPTALQLPPNYLLVTIDANTLRTVTPPSSTAEPSNNSAVQKEPPSDTSVKNANGPNSPVENALSCFLKDLKSRWKSKADKKDMEKINNCENINNINAQETVAKEISTKSLVSESSINSISKSDEEALITRNEFDEELINVSSEGESVEKPPRKKIKLANHAESLSLREDEGLLLKAIERQNHILEGMAKTLTRIEKSLEERSTEEALKKNSMLVKISDNLEQLGESLRTVSKSLKSI